MFQYREKTKVFYSQTKCVIYSMFQLLDNRTPNLSKNDNINEMSAVFALYSRTYIINLVNVISFLLGNKDIRQIFFIYILYFCMQYLYYFLSYNLKCTEDDKQICFSKNVLRANVICSLLLFSMLFCFKKILLCIQYINLTNRTRMVHAILCKNKLIIKQYFCEIYLMAKV